MIFQIIVGLALVGSSYQRTELEIRAWFFGQAVECNTEHPIEPNEMVMMKNHKIPDSDSAKCLMACVFRRASWLNDKGMFDVDKVNEQMEKEFKDDPKKLENSKMVFDICKSVNEVAVKDGEKGCDRAYHISKCLTENAAKGGFRLEQI